MIVLTMKLLPKKARRQKPIASVVDERPGAAVVEGTCPEDERTGQYSLAKEVARAQSGYHAKNYLRVEANYPCLFSSIGAIL